MPLSRKFCKSSKRKTNEHKKICKKYGLRRKMKSRRKSSSIKSSILQNTKGKSKYKFYFKKNLEKIY